MKKRLEEIERNMESILKEVNKNFNSKYRTIEISLWPKRPKPFKINLWDGKDHAPLNKLIYNGTAEELINWVTRRKILFQKFDGILQKEESK